MAQDAQDTAVPNGKMVTIETTRDSVQATFLKSFLVNEGIDAQLNTDRSVGFTGRYSAIGRGIQVQTPEDQAERARELLEEVEAGVHAVEDDYLVEESEEPEPDARGDYEPSACPSCASENVMRGDGGGWVGTLVTILFLGLPWLLRTPTWICRDCGWEWQAGEDQDVDEPDSLPEDMR